MDRVMDNLFNRPVRRKPGRPRETDWPSIIDTDYIYSEQRGVDFRGTIASRRTYVHATARKHNKRVRTQSRGDEIRYQFRSAE